MHVICTYITVLIFGEYSYKTLFSFFKDYDFTSAIGR